MKRFVAFVCLLSVFSAAAVAFGGKLVVEPRGLTPHGAVAHGGVQTFPRDGWANASVSRTGDGWVVKAGSDSLRIVGSPRDKGFGAMVVVSNTADALVVDAGEAFAKGAECILMYSSAIDLKPIDGRDVMVRSVWSGSRGTKCGVLLEGSDRNGKHWWRSGRVTPTERPRTFRHAHKVDEGMRGLHYRLDLSLAKGPILFHKLEIGPYSELAPSPPPRARPELIFHAPFDGDARAAFAKGDPAPCKASGLEYAKGRRGKAVRLSSALKSALAYNLKGNLNPACGTIAFWFRHEWKETKRLGYRDDNGKEIWRYILSAPAESRHLGDGCLGLWWWRDAVRMDRGDLDHRYSYFWYSKPGDAWRHYVVVWDDYGTRLYCDGRLAGTSDSWSPMKEALAEADPLEFDRDLSAFKTFFVGSTKDGGYRLDGLVDDLRIWSAPMLKGEALDLYRQEQDATLSPDVYYGTEGEAKTIRVKVKSIGGRRVPAGTRVRLVDASGKTVAEGSPVANGTSTLSATLPRGEYSLALPDGIICDRVPYWVLGRGNPVEAQGELAKRHLYTVKPDLATLSPDRFRSVGQCRMGELGGVKYLEAGPSQGSRFALRLNFETNTPIHCIEIDYPDDGYRTMDLIVQRSRNPQSDYTLQVGRYGGRDVPVSGKMLTYRCLYWTTSEDATLVAMTARPDSPAAIAEVRVYAVESGALPPTPVIGGGRTAGERRHFGSYWEDPAINYDYGVNHSSAASLDKLIDRKAAYMKFCGEDTLAYPGSWYHGLIAHDIYNPRFHSRHFLQAWCEKFDREGLRIVPTVNQQTVPIEEGVVTRAAMTDGSLHPTTISIHDTGKPNWGGWHSTPPNFCIYHPDVQREFLRIFDALIADGAGHPSFSGICLHLTSITCPWWGSIASGYNDYCIDAFEKATRVKVPVDRKDPLRGKAYAEWLKANAYEKWVQWRCDVLCDFYVKLAKRLAAARPDLRLWVNAMPSSRPSDPDYAQDGYREKCMREAGIDAAQLVRRIPNLVMGTTLSPCGFRHVGMRTPGTPELLEKVRTYPDAPGYYSVFRPALFTWLNLHDNYWESPVGAGKTGNLLTCDWLQEATWRVTALQANGRNAMKYYAVPFLHNDIQMISCGGFLEGSYGMEEMMARFAQYFRALPAVKFPTVAKNGNVVLRGGEAEGKSWFYIVNADERPARVEISVPARTVDLATRVRLGSDACARRVALDLEPYEFRSFAAPSGRPVLH